MSTPPDDLNTFWGGYCDSSNPERMIPTIRAPKDATPEEKVRARAIVDRLGVTLDKYAILPTGYTFEWTTKPTTPEDLARIIDKQNAQAAAREQAWRDLSPSRDWFLVDVTPSYDWPLADETP